MLLIICKMWEGMIVYANQQCTWWIYCPGHAGMWISERVNRLVLRMPAVGTLKIDKRDIMQTFNECMLVEVTITDGTEGSRMLEFEIKYGSNRNRHIVQSSQLWLSYRNRHMRGQIWLAYNQWETGMGNIYTLQHLREGTKHLWVCLKNKNWLIFNN